GPKRKAKLNSFGIRTIVELAHTSPHFLRKCFGIIGDYLHNAAWGLDDGEVKSLKESTLPKSLSISITLSKNTKSPAVLRAALLSLADKLAYQLRQKKLTANTISIVLRFADLTFSSKQKNLKFPTSETKIIFKEICRLSEWYLSLNQSVRLVGVSASNLTAEEFVQFSLFPEFEIDKKVYKTLDKIREKFGEDILFYGGTFHAQKYLKHKL
ncbi:MAG: hypothetical protein Q8M92_10740, partial [Candidatus Subteraquimicrobiales bacterium]|nr:hypothetical protein [Candidatus Subteraquimicrobiales bacterium]